MESKTNNRSQSQEVSISLNGFQINLSHQGKVLTIEAEGLGSESRIFSTQIEDTEVENRTKSLFQDSLALYHGLQDALTLTDPSITIKFSEEGILSYSWETQHGSKKRLFEFIISLKELNLDPIKTLERKVEKLQKKVQEQDARIAWLESGNGKIIKSESDAEKALIDKIETFEKKVLPELLEENTRLGQKLEASVQEKIQKFEQLIKDMEQKYNCEDRLDYKMNAKLSPYKFNSSAKNACYFDFSNEKQSVTLTTNFTNTTWKLIYADKPLPKTSTSFSIKIDKSWTNNIMIGIVPSDYLQFDNCYNLSGVYMYCAQSGIFYYNGSHGNMLSPSFAGSIITVTTDLSENRIEWTLSDGKSWSILLDGSRKSSSQYYPCIELRDENDTVSFVQKY